MPTASITSPTGPLDVQGLVDQLIAVEQRPLNRLKQQLTSYQTQISDYGTLSADLSALQTSLVPLSSGQFVNTLSATSSNSAVLSASANTTASSGMYAITVANLATAQNLAYTGRSSHTTSLANTADTLNFTFSNGATPTVTIPANASLDQISSAINAAGIGVSATVLQADNSATPYRLVLTGTTVGSDNAFSTSTLSGQSALSFLNFDVNVVDSRLTQAAVNASLTVNGLSLSSSTNTLSNVIEGVTVNLTQAGTSNLIIATDINGISSQVQSFVTAFNKCVSDSNQYYKGDLRGDYTLINLQNQFDKILNTPISGANGTTTVAYLAQVGVSLQKDGTLSLDQSALSSAISYNKAAVANVFGNSNYDGFAQRLNAEINTVLGPLGLVTARHLTLNHQTKTLEDEITQEQERLNMLRVRYLALYSNLNASLAQMQRTSDSLTTMLESLKKKTVRS